MTDTLAPRPPATPRQLALLQDLHDARDEILFETGTTSGSGVVSAAEARGYVTAVLAATDACGTPAPWPTAVTDRLTDIRSPRGADVESAAPVMTQDRQSDIVSCDHHHSARERIRRPSRPCRPTQVQPCWA